MKIRQLSLCFIWMTCIMLGLPKISFGEEVVLPEKLNITKQVNPAINVSGLVTDMVGEPLIGVNIQVKGTAIGASTDFQGNYSLNNVREDAILVFSYIGYQTKEVTVEGRTTINLEMASDAQLLDELVVVGYGTQKRPH